MMFIKEEHKQMLLSYARSVLAAVVAVVATGNTAPDDLVKAALAAALPPIIRWINPNDPAFGRGSF
jgi:predicted ATPase